MNEKSVFEADCSHGNTDVFHNRINIYQSRTSILPFYEKVKIYDINKKLMLQVVVTGFFGIKRKIELKTNDLDRDLLFNVNKRKIELRVDDKNIVFKQYCRAFKFEGDFYVNNVYVGSIRNKLSFFTSRLIYDFVREDEMNYFCIILSLILLRNEFNSGGD